MKKILLILSTVLLVVSCGDMFQADMEAPFLWKIQNRTDQTVRLRYPSEVSFTGRDTQYMESYVAPWEVITVYAVLSDKMLPYDLYLEKSAKALGEDVSWQILSEDGEVLRIWKYSEKDGPDEVFFEESSWHKNDHPVEFSRRYYSRTFMITQDILSIR